jgi:hypothetical protein
LNKFQGKQNMGAAKAAVTDAASMQLDAARQAAEEDQSPAATGWTAVMTLAEVVEVLDPSNAKVERVKRQALEEINRPRVVGMPSFVEHEGTVTVFLNVFFPETGKEVDYRPREGEVFAEGKMRLKEVIGNMQGVRIAYTSDGKEITLKKR